METRKNANVFFCLTSNFPANSENSSQTVTKKGSQCRYDLRFFKPTFHGLNRQLIGTRYMSFKGHTLVDTDVPGVQGSPTSVETLPVAAVSSTLGI